MTRRTRTCVSLVLAFALSRLFGRLEARQDKTANEQQVCGHALQGFVRLQNGPPVRRAVIEEVAEPQLTVVLRTKTDLHGRFQLPYARRARGRHVLLRISAPGVPTTLVKIKMDPTCGDPLITITPPVAPTGGGAR